MPLTDEQIDELISTLKYVQGELTPQADRQTRILIAASLEAAEDLRDVKGLLDGTLKYNPYGKLVPIVDPYLKGDVWYMKTTYGGKAVPTISDDVLE